MELQRLKDTIQTTIEIELTGYDKEQMRIHFGWTNAETRRNAKAALNVYLDELDWRGQITCTTTGEAENALFTISLINRPDYEEKIWENN